MHPNHKKMTNLKEFPYTVYQEGEGKTVQVQHTIKYYTTEDLEMIIQEILKVIKARRQAGG